MITAKSPYAFKWILYEKRDRIAYITMNDPARLNTISRGPGGMANELLAALDLADADDDIYCSVIAGAGGTFSAGGDLAGGVPAGATLKLFEFLEEADRMHEHIRNTRKPTIGAINGVCYGAALIMAMHLDLLVAAESARLGMIEARFGGVGAETLPFLVSIQWAKFLMLSGEIITATRAREIGLVLEVFPDDRFAAKVDDLARRVSAMPRQGVMFNRRLINDTVTAMGWSPVQKEMAIAMNTVVSSQMSEALALNGRTFAEIMRNDGWKAFKEARDTPFATPWLED